jgi:hypothetical protein
MEHTEKLFKHVVLWKLMDQAEGKTKAENAAWMKAHLEALVDVVPQLLSAQVGINVNTSADAYDAVLISTFKSEADCAAYKVHPAHVAVSNYCQKVRLSRIVCDYWEDVR